MRFVLVITTLLLLGAGLVLGYIAVIAARRSEGVFVPAGYVAVACLAAAYFTGRAAVHP